MLTEQNKRIINRIPEELYNEGNLAVADEVFAPDYIEHFPLPPGFPTGIDGVKTFVTSLRTAFAGFYYTIEDSIAEGDKVVVRVTAQGKHIGDFMGLPATGKSATWSEIHICRMAGGKLVEHWVEGDRLGMLQQLGVVPAMDVP